MIQIRDLTILLAAAVLSVVAHAQPAPQTSPETISSKDSGELHSALTSQLAIEATARGERLFVIFHRGSYDSSPYITLNRMLQLKAYFAVHQRFGVLEPVYAIGDDVKGEGRIDYYLGSSLRLLVFAKRNSVPNFTCCPDYIPPKRSRKKARSIRR